MVQTHQDSCETEKILIGGITAWYGNCSASDRKELQRVVRMAQYITGAKLPAIQDLYFRRSEEGLKSCQTPATQVRLFSATSWQAVAERQV